MFLCYSLIVYKYSDPRQGSLRPGEQVLAGWDTWQQKNCQSCHQIYGLGGYAGPDLTNTVRQRSPEYLKAIIKSGTAAMPDFRLSPKQVDELVAFLDWVDKTGASKVPDSLVHWTGSYRQ